jgi:cell wall-associated NlpC family hydrolase
MQYPNTYRPSHKTAASAVQSCLRIALAGLALVGLLLPPAAHAQTKQPPTPDALGALLDRIANSPKATLDAASDVTANVLDVAQHLVANALGLIGVKYTYGGNTPEQGLDCSGFVKLVFQQTMGMSLPRQSHEMSKLGETVEQASLMPGDLVFFNTLRRSNSHVGIYIGDGQFVHSPSSGGKVRVENLSAKYWQSRFDGAKRIQTQP